MFLRYLSHKGLLCCEKQVRREGGVLVCAQCDRRVLDVYEALPKMECAESCHMAGLYAGWTGDLNVPCRVALFGIPGILPTKDLVVPYSTLHRCNLLLGAANQEFIEYRNRHFESNATIRTKVMENLLVDFAKKMGDLEEGEAENSIRMAMKQMEHMFEEKNILEYYVNVLCPYVKLCRGSFEKVEGSVDDSSPFLTFCDLVKQSVEIRETFGRFCVYFDVVYVIIFCCLSDTELISNFVLDLAVKLCRGHYDVPNELLDRVGALSDQTFRENRGKEGFFLQMHIDGGEVGECLSDRLPQEYQSVQEAVERHYDRAVSLPSEAIKNFAFSQNFPYVLFRKKSKDYYAFMLAFSYLVKRYEAAKGYEPGSCANSKLIFKFVKRAMDEISEFNANGQPVAYWNVEMLKAFFSSNRKIVEEFRNVARLLQACKWI